MTSKERVRAALEHRQPDKVPVDFGSTAVTGISASTVYKLRKAFKLADKPIRVTCCYQLLGEIDEELLEKLDCDCIPIMAYNNMFGFRNDGWKPWTLFDGTPVLVPANFNTKVEQNGGIFQYPEGDTTAPPSGFIPKGGYYFDAIVRQEPFDDDNPSVKDNTEEFVPIKEEELRYAQQQAESLSKTERAVIGGIGGTALGDVSMVPAVFLKNPKGIRDITEWYVTMGSRQDFLKEVFDRQSEVAVENLKRYYQAVGDNIDILYLCGTDFGTQMAPMCSTVLFDEVYLPYYRRMTDWIHQNTKWKIFKHCCGSIMPLVPSLIKAGIDILNPVQNSAAGMDPGELKEKFGSKITFWGGGVDTQKTLPFGTPQEVYDQVIERIKIYNQNGGFVFNTIHNTQLNTPIENFLAMLEAVKQFRK
ncbi:putative methyltransferase CmuC [Treponema primitia ZAS-2]|uniref:Putative methyltransferase CmuC n=1 Tax=Treponema primitia (strain ATCC BAA-887 / DSM 12427 / ZAS-2) TaxID=545694 RepID=F5YPH6_TREPZ|nr:uroporphyrinogen decarboxylase family protein [Treponema primitia]AEF83958.1 putative methyltransferase CmuC [Treponema primitia ZAS-2]